MDPPDKTKQLAESLGLGFPLLSDTHRTLTKAYGLLDAENNVPWPAVYLISRSGRVVWRWLATSYKKRPSVDDLVAALSKLEVKLNQP